MAPLSMTPAAMPVKGIGKTSKTKLKTTEAVLVEESEDDASHVSQPPLPMSPASENTQDDGSAAVIDTNLHNDVDALLASELNQMSMKERDQVLLDVHGVSDVMKESPTFVSDKLHGFDDEMLKITRKPAYEQALQANATYVRNKRIQFLRAESFQCSKAAQRMVSYYEQKLSLFGPSKLAKDISYLDDLDEHDRESLESGYAQLLPSRDQGGRVVLFIVPPIWKFKTKENCLRSVWYLVETAAKDVENQKRGVTFTVYNVGPNRVFDPMYTRRVGQILHNMPLRLTGVHYCFDNPTFYIVTSIAMLAMGKHSRVRFRPHYGSHKECQLALRTYGIPQYLIPVTEDGQCKLENHYDWCEQRKKQEQQEHDNMINNGNNHNTDSAKLQQGQQQEQQEGQIDLPGYYDVLFGRGKAVFEHPGNVRFHDVLDVYESRYNNSTKLGKGAVVEEIISIVKKSSGRFLKKDLFTGKWEEVEMDAARDKVSQAYRTRRATGNQHKQLLQQEQQQLHIQQQQHVMMQNTISMTGVEFTPGTALVTTERNNYNNNNDANLPTFENDFWNSYGYPHLPERTKRIKL